MSTSDLIGYLVVAAVILGPWLLNLLKKAGEADKKNKSRLQGNQPPEPTGTAGRGSPDTQASTHLTMAQRIAQARARAASTTRRGTSPPAASARAAQSRVPTATSSQAQRQAQRQAQAAQRQALAQQQRAQQQARLQRQQQLALRKAQRAALAKAQRARQLQQQRAQQEQQQRRRQQQTARARRDHVQVLPEPTEVIAPSASWRKLDRRSIRRAIILKEVLDQPIALRSTPVI